MAVVKDSIKISFGGGLDQKTDAKQISADEFLALNNMVFTVGGRLTKRNGFAGGFTKAVTSPNPSLTYSVVPGTLSSARKVFSYNNELLLNDAWNLYSWDSSALSWVYKGRETRVGLSTQNIIGGINPYQSADMSVDTTSGIKVYAGVYSLLVGVIYSIQDTVTGQFIVNQALMGANFYNPRCVSISGKSWIFAVNISDQKLYYQAIVGQTVTGSPTAIISDLNASQPNYDVDVDTYTGNIYLSYYTSGPSVKIVALSSSLAIGNSISVTGATAGNGVSWFGDGSNIWTVYASATQVNAFSVNNAVTVTTGTDAIIDSGSTGAAVNNVTGVWSSVQNKAFIFYDPILFASGGFTDSAVINYRTAVIAAGAVTPQGSAAQFVGSVSINSKAFAVNGIPHLLGLYSYYSIIQTSDDAGNWVAKNFTVQPTNFLFNLYNTNSTMGGAGNPPRANIAAKISPDEASQTAPVVGLLCGVHQSSSGVWELASLQSSNYSIETVQPIFSPQGVIGCSFNFNDTNPDVQSLGNNALIAGGQVAMYDSASVVEQNFHIYPNSLGTVIATTGGSLGLASADTTYSYIYTYEWIDNQGRVHRSFPSPVVTPIASGHNYTFASGVTAGKVTLTIPNLRVTEKSGVSIRIYRTTANGSVYYLLGGGAAILVNDPSTDTITYVDNESANSDKNVIGNLQLYTTGALGYYAPPASSALTNFKNRAIQVGSEDPYQVGYSNAVLQNFPVQFVPEFLQNIGTVGGALITVAQMDDKMILFKSGKISGPAIYYMQGQGPAASGANNDFQDPLPITVDAGCVDRPSVVLTPVGLMFKSDKGIYLIDRSLQASYIGAQVEGYNQYSVLSSQLIPNTTQVRFFLSNGTLLMYDYLYKKWATWTPPAGISDCIFQGQHTYVDATGQVYQETPGLYVDGTATPVLWSFTTAWIKLMGLQGYQRAFWFLLIGDYISAHKLAVSLYTDFSTTPDSSVTITPNSQDALENWRVFFTKQRCQSFQVQMSEVYTGTLGQGLNLSGVNLVVGAKSKYRTISAAQSTG